MMHGYPKAQRTLLALCLGVFSMTAQAFDSGSTGVDGAFSPTVNTTVELPPSGIFNYTTVNIPTGVTVTFKKNAANTPVVMLATGNVMIAGTLNVSGTAGVDGGAAGDGNQGDDGQPGLGGVGGFDGGRGGLPGLKPSGGGNGPGGGTGATHRSGDSHVGGGGAGYNGDGASAVRASGTTFGGLAGTSYGSTLIQPLIGGSGGGGGSGGSNFEGTGGGGGGGALLIASSGTVNVTGTINANGGRGGNFTAGERAGTGGGGSGGSIRIVSTTISGNGAINAIGGSRGDSTVHDWDEGGNGAAGRIRLEAETITRSAGTSPAYATDLPGTVFLAGMPTLKIVSVAGVTVPEVPTGNADVTLPTGTSNPVTVLFQTANVPVGNTVLLTVIPASGLNTSVISPALAGSTQNANANVSVTLPTGPSVLQAQTTYTIVAALGDALSVYAENERVERITLVTALNGPAMAYLETVSGKRFQASPEALALVAAGS